jgi:predicted alpha/beta-hydrolase family hydrolase
MPRSSELVVPTPAGPARVVPALAKRAWATLVLGHGAGGGLGARDLVALAERLPAEGVSVLLVESPWRVAGRRAASPPATLDVAWRVVVPAVVEAGMAGGALILGGRSAGARVACRTAAELAAAGVLALAFPLHPPGRPQASRLAELLGAGVPTLVVQGERDPFGAPAEFPEEVELYPIRGADHGFRVPARAVPGQAAALGELVSAALAWAERVAEGTPNSAGGNR